MSLLLMRDGVSERENGVDLQPRKLDCNFGEARGASFGPPILNCNGATLDPAELPRIAAQSQLFWIPRGRRVRPKYSMVGSLSDCCARAASGHTAAAMKSGKTSRRLMTLPKPKTAAYHIEWGPLCITAKPGRRCPLWVINRRAGHGLS